MKTIAGVDIGNTTTEVCIGRAGDDGRLTFLSSSIVSTTGTKGAVENTEGVKAALYEACAASGIDITQLDVIRINEAAPVIGATAMETITETRMTGSAMIGHNPNTPAGVGAAAGRLMDIEDLPSFHGQEDVIVLASSAWGFEKTAAALNQYASPHIVGLILQNDEAVLVENRIHIKIPIIDEVKGMAGIPRAAMAAMEVAPPGETVRLLSNPYGVATLLQLTPEETRASIPVAKSLMGKKSGVVIQSPTGVVKENRIPAGSLYFHGKRQAASVNIDSGADAVMNAMALAGAITDVTGEENTNIGAMLHAVKGGQDAHITDLLAVDAFVHTPIFGAAAGETSLEKAVAVAAMVQTDALPMQKIAERLGAELGVYVKVAGVEAVMAALGALTTPGTSLPIAILDMGGGSTDAAVMDENGVVVSTHLAGAGELVTMMIQSELGLASRQTAEEIKKHPAAKVESLFHIRLESGRVLFYDEPLPPKYFGRVVLLEPNGLLRIEEDIPMERIAQARREAKQKVFLANARRALQKVAPGGRLRNIQTVVLVGGSAEDFEIPEMLTTDLSIENILCGRGNVRRLMGPRNAVATGLVMSYFG